MKNPGHLRSLYQTTFMAEASATAARPDRPTGRLDARWRNILVALALSVLSEIATWDFVRGYGFWVLGQSLGLRSLCRWDCLWYASVVLYGYDAVPSRHPAGDAANWAFLPLFPLLAGLWHGLAGFGFEDALIVTGTLALPVCVYLIIEFVDAGDIAVSPWVSGSLVAFGPYALSAHTGYSEPLRGAARMQLMPTIDAPAVIQRNLAHLELPGVRAGPSLPFTGRAARAGQPVCCPCCGLGRLDEKPSGRRQEGVPRLSSLE